MNILQALDDPQGVWSVLPGPTWVVWRVFLAVLFGLPLTSEQLALYTKHTGRTVTPTSPLHEAWFVSGDAAGKVSSSPSSRSLSLLQGLASVPGAPARSAPS